MKEFGKGAKEIDMTFAMKVTNRKKAEEKTEEKAEEKDLSNKEKVQCIALLVTLPTLLLIADIIGGIFHLWG